MSNEQNTIDSLKNQIQLLIEEFEDQIEDLKHEKWELEQEIDDLKEELNSSE